MPLKKNEIQVFISYARKDFEFAEKIFDALSLIDGISPWLDRRKLLPGTNWDDEILSAIEESRFSIVVLSSHSVEKTGYIQKEFKAVIERLAHFPPGKIYLIPIRLVDCRVGYRELKKIQHIDMFPDWDKGLDQITDTIRKELQWNSSCTLPGGYSGNDFSRSVDLARLPIPRFHKLLGREKKLLEIKFRLADENSYIEVVYGFGGVGKSALVSRVLDELAPEYDGAQSVFGWSFYSQGSHLTSTSAAPFFAEALQFFDPGCEIPANEFEQARKLAYILRKKRSLLVLDGLEPLQHPPSEAFGRLRDRQLQSFLMEVAREGIDGLVVVTSRQPVEELHRYERSVHHMELGVLDEKSAVTILELLGVRGASHTLKEAAREVQCQPLALVLLGNLLSTYYMGDAGQYRVLPAVWDVDVNEAEHATRILKHYDEIWGPSSQQVAVLERLALIDRPMSQNEMDVVFGAAESEVPVPSHPFFKKLLNDLTIAGLVYESPIGVDCHPLVRSYFSNRLKVRSPEKHAAVHKALFNYFIELPEFNRPSSLSELEPLYRAIFHGCESGLVERSLKEIYEHRIQRGGDYYSMYELGAFSMELFALSCFLPEGWNSPPRPPLSSEEHARLLDNVAFCYLSLGRMREAAKALEAGAALAEKLGDRLQENPASLYRNLVEARLALGETNRALEAAQMELRWAKQSDDVEDEMIALGDFASVLYHIGDLDAAVKTFKKVRAISQGRTLNQYTLFQECECRLSTSSTAYEFEEIALTSTSFLEDTVRPIHKALFGIVAAHARFFLGKTNISENLLFSAIQDARDSGSDETLAYVLATAAELLRKILITTKRAGDFDRVLSLADEAIRIAELGEMRLYSMDARFALTELALDQEHVDEANQHLSILAQELSFTGFELRRTWHDSLLKRIKTMKNGSIKLK